MVCIQDPHVVCTRQGSSRVAVKVGGQWSAKPGEATKDVNAPMFQYEGSAITSMSPNFSPTSGGTVMTLYGNDFADVRSGVSSVPLEIKIITPAVQLPKRGPEGGGASRYFAFYCIPWNTNRRPPPPPTVLRKRSRPRACLH